MTDVTLETLNRRAAIAAVRAEADRAGIDADAILDRRSFYDRVTALDPDDPGFASQVRTMVTQAAPPARHQPEASTSDETGQWTMEDVKRATPGEMVAAADAGKLRQLGYGPRRPRR